MKKILLILGHPYKKSYNYALFQAYKRGAKNSKQKAEIKELILSDLKFDINLKWGYSRIQKLEPDLVEAQNLIKWADHLVFFYPVWWSEMPAILKGFFDRTFLPGFAYHFTSLYAWDKYLKGKSARLIVTMDSPTLVYRFYFGAPSFKAVKKGLLKFCGVSPVKISAISRIKFSSKRMLQKKLKYVEKLGRKLK